MLPWFPTFMLLMHLFFPIVRIPGPGGTAPSGGGGGPVFVNSVCGGGSTSSSQAFTSAVDMTVNGGASVILIGTSTYSANGPSNAPGDGTNTYTEVSHPGWSTSTQGQWQWWYKESPTVTSSMVFSTPSLTISFPELCVIGFGGTITGGGDSAVTQGTNVNATTLTIPSGTPGHNAEVIVAGISISAAATMAINGSFTGLKEVNYNLGTAFGAAIAYWIQTTATASGPQWSGPGVSQQMAGGQVGWRSQ